MMELLISVCHIAMSVLMRLLTKRHVNFVVVKQMFSHCGQQWLWKVNPTSRIHQQVFSGAILFSVATPVKIF